MNKRKLFTSVLLTIGLILCVVFGVMGLEYLFSNHGLITFYCLLGLAGLYIFAIIVWCFYKS